MPIVGGEGGSLSGSRVELNPTGTGGRYDQATVPGAAPSRLVGQARSPYESVVRQDGPIAYWRLGEAAGTVADDAVGANEGTYVASPTLGVTGALASDTDTAVTFNGSTQTVTVADSTPLRFDGTKTFSVEVWFKHTADGTFRRLVSCEDPNDGKGWQLYSANAGYGFKRTGATAQEIATAAGIDTNWHHFVGTYDGTSMRAFIDTAELPGSPLTSAASLPTTSTFTIGSFANAINYFNGSLDEVAVYNYALTLTQVLAHWNVGIAGLHPATDTLAALSDAATRASQALSRTVTDAPAAPSDIATRSAQAKTRTLSDSLAALSDAASRASQAKSRTVTDSLSALSDAASRAGQASSRTLTDTLAALSDAATRSAQAISRSATDSLAAQSDAATRSAQARTRTVTDSLAALSDAASRAATAASRTAVDSIAAITDIATRTEGQERVAADSISAFSETTSRQTTASRTVTDSIAAISDAASSGGVASRTAVDSISGLADTATASVVPITPVVAAGHAGRSLRAIHIVPNQTSNRRLRSARQPFAMPVSARPEPIAFRDQRAVDAMAAAVKEREDDETLILLEAA